MMTVTARAKTNLTLEALKKRDDGYHDIRSIVQTIDFCDKLGFQSNSVMEYHCNLPEWSAEKSLISKTVELLKSTTGCTKNAIIQIEKRIPLSSGLGGDSSNAASVIRGLNIVWNLQLTLPQMLKIAAQLGSDVPLFLHGGTLLMEGKGEKITPLRPMPHMNIILLIPSLLKVENKTRQMYAHLSSRSYTDGALTEEFIKRLDSRAKPDEFRFYNVFDEIALKFFAGLKESRQLFLAAGAKEVHLAGSGPTLFTLISDDTEASSVYKNLRDKGLEAYLTDF